MINKNAFKIVIPIAGALGIVFLLGAVRHVTSIDQAGANHAIRTPQTVELPNPALSRIRLLVSNPN